MIRGFLSRIKGGPAQAPSSAPPVSSARPPAREIASADRDIFHLVFAGLMRPQDDILTTRSGGQGLRVYDEIARDPLVGALLQKRYAAVVSRPWTVEPASVGRADRKAAELVQRVLGGDWGLRYDRICYEQLDAILKGYSVGEVMWKVTQEGFFVPDDVKPKDPRRFVFNDQQQLRLLTFQDMFLGEELPQKKFLVHQFGDKVGDPYGLGLGNRLFWPVFFKRQGTQFWLTFAEKFGSPTVVGKYPVGMLDAEQDKLFRIISDISQRSAVAIPDEAKLELLEASRTGSAGYGELVRYMDEQITVAVLGETLTTSIKGGGSRAASQTHDDVREQLADFDADLLCAAHQAQLISWIVELNCPGAKPPFLRRGRIAKLEEEAVRDQKQVQARTMMVQFVTQARQAGWAPADETLDLAGQWQGEWKWTGIPSGPAIAPDAVQPQTEQADTAFDDKNQYLGDVHPRDVADDLADQLHDAAAPSWEVLISKVRAMVESAESLDEVADGLVTLYPDLDPSRLAAVMGQAMLLAELTGRSEIADGR